VSNNELSIYGGGTRIRVRVRALEKRRCWARAEREKERPAFAGTNVSARNNQSGKEENSTPEQAEHKVNVEVLGEQTACLIV
jgi:hypothetical protein